MKVTKRDGTYQEYDIEKMHKEVAWACEGLSASVSAIELNSQVQMYNGISTRDIHEVLVKSAADLISVETPDYSIAAGRLNNHGFRKEAYGDFRVPRLYDHVCRLVEAGLYTSELLEYYSEDEFDMMDVFINHDRDMEYHYAATCQLRDKYLVRDRSDESGRVSETPQVMNMLISAMLFAEEPQDRMEYVESFYEILSTGLVSLPTPIMAGLRTPTKQFSSCVLIECDDSLDSINASSAAIIEYISKRAGIGINGGRIRAVGSKIGNGEVVHTGVIPFWKHFQTAVKSCSQGGIRNGAATLYYPIWHRELPELLVLKNNAGTEETRIRHLDYGVQLSKFFIDRFKAGKNITLFSPDVADGELYRLYFEDQEAFVKLYEELEQDKSIQKEVISAVDALSSLAQERIKTGRIYLMFVDNVIEGTPFDSELAPVRQSNLCTEILLPTKPLQHVEDPNGEIALCTLAAVNMGKTPVDQLHRVMPLLVRALDNLLSYQDYLLPAAKRSVDQFRPLGIGVIGYAHYLAKHGFKYGEGLAETRQYIENMQFYGLMTSAHLAKQRGACHGFERTKYAKGWLKADAVPEEEKVHDWEFVRHLIKNYGVRNATILAFMPSETSSQISNETSGIEPVRGLITVKKSKSGVMKQVVPEIEELADEYQLLWTMPDNSGYLSAVAEINKFTCQAISVNTNYDPAKFEGGRLPVKQVLKDIFKAHKLGLTTMYYHNTNDGQDEALPDDGCGGGACKI